MIQCLHPSQRPILVAASDASDAALIRSAIARVPTDADTDRDAPDTAVRRSS